MSKRPDEQMSNPSKTPHFETIMQQYLSRRQTLQGGLTGLTVAFLGGMALGGCTDDDEALEPAPSAPSLNTSVAPLLGFTSLAASTEDAIRVPPGYSFTVIAKWGDPIGHISRPAGSPAFRSDASNTAAEQALQVGTHNDGMHYFSLPLTGNSSTRGLLVMNHEYTDDGLLHVGGIDIAPTAANSTLPGGFVSPTGWTLEKVLKAQNAVGVSIQEVSRDNGQWRVIQPSIYARRITANTPILLGGPAAGSPLLRTAFDVSGTAVLGTFSNCANGYTPWGTYLTCEENWNGSFVNVNGTIVGVSASQQQRLLAEQLRYGVRGSGFGTRWNEFDERFDASRHPNEPNRFGWVVEIDPYDAAAIPIKRTALGRIKHESAALSIAADNRVVFYMGDDERNEYIYKFVSRDPYNPNDSTANHDLLDFGTLYVAQFNADGSGSWLRLVHGENGLTPANGFADQAEVLIKTRQAADRAGATMMDRPEWTAVHPQTKEVYVTLTNNSRRGTTPPSSNNPDGSTTADASRPPVDAANPRAANTHGHILRWREAGGDPKATTFTWDIFVLAGDPASSTATNRGNIQGALFSSPDGLYIDQRGLMWIETDVSTSSLFHPSLATRNTEFQNFGNNQLLAADPTTREIRRFLTGPVGCELTGIAMTPDGRTLFVNIQHPGEPLSADQANNAADNPTRFSRWPDGGRPRSATVVITKDDGGPIGT